MRIIAIGGGGSGGGNGGNARANVNTTSYHTGGDGGKGSCGSYATSNDVILQGSNIQIQIGTGGAAGANGANDSDNNVTGSAKATGQNGFTNPGIATVIIHNGITYSASGGIGGVGGKGGDSAANEPGGQSGSDGANGQPNYTQIATTPATWPSLSQYGIGGNGGTKNNAGDIITNATAGGDGAARIIWLYQ
jgi:hypothetical protein